MDTIIKWFKNHNIMIQLGKDERKTFIKWKEEEIKFYIEEEIKRFDYIPTEKEKAENQGMSFYPYPKWRYEPTGNLRIKIDESWTGSIRKTWRDTNSQRIEACLHDFIINTFKASLLKHKRSLELEEERRMWQEKVRIKREEEQRRQEVQRRFKDLEEMAISWNKRKLILQFIKDVKQQANSTISDPVEIKKVNDWIKWAKDYAMKIDPVNSILKIMPT